MPDYGSVAAIYAGKYLARHRHYLLSRPGYREFVRVRITHRLHGSIDGMQLERFQPGRVYDVGSMLGAVMLAERWAEPVDDGDIATVSPVTTVRQFAEPPVLATWRRRAPLHQRAIAADRSARRTPPKSQKGR
jgi:hypothetical protein